MLKIVDQNFVAKFAELDENDQPVKVIADRLGIVHQALDFLCSEPTLTITFGRFDALGRQIGPVSQYLIQGDALATVLTPKEGEGNRKLGDFRISDAEDILMQVSELKDKCVKDETAMTSVSPVMTKISPGKIAVTPVTPIIHP